MVHRIVNLTIYLHVPSTYHSPGNNLFRLDKLMIPINITNTHWLLACVFLKENRVQIYDSFPPDDDDRQYWLDVIKKYLSEEYRHLHDRELPGAD